MRADYVIAPGRAWVSRMRGRYVQTPRGTWWPTSPTQVLPWPVCNRTGRMEGCISQLRRQKERWVGHKHTGSGFGWIAPAPDRARAFRSPCKCEIRSTCSGFVSRQLEQPATQPGAVAQSAFHQHGTEQATGRSVQTRPRRTALVAPRAMERRSRGVAGPPQAQPAAKPRELASRCVAGDARCPARSPSLCSSHACWPKPLVRALTSVVRTAAVVAVARQ
jgi:hypothetical protein